MTVALITLTVVAVGLAVALFLARRDAREQSDLLWATTWALIHAINGTEPETYAIADELEEARFCAGVWLIDGYPEDSK
jgi:hypothetical protein